MVKTVSKLARKGYSRGIFIRRNFALAMRNSSGVSVWPSQKGREGFFAMTRPEVIDFLLEGGVVSTGDLVLDCGSHKGQYMPAFLKKGAKIIAFEPNPHAAAFLQERLGAKANFELRQVAVSTADASRRLHLRHNAAEDPVHWARSSSLLSEKDNVSADDFIEVEAIDLSRFILGLACRVKFLKIDIEGEEVAVINQLIDSGAIDRVDYIAAELHDGSNDFLVRSTSELRKRIFLLGLDRKVNFHW
jgi:FkbM family methyltransferase